MSETAATTTPILDVVATNDSPQSPGGSDQTVVVSQMDHAVNQETMLPQPGSRVATFSTELGTRPKRGVSEPAPPVIVRSGDRDRNVWHSAHYWREKYRMIGFAIFPGLKWIIEDFWDDEDIHIETCAHLQNVLEFIKQDNAITAGLYARDWAQAKNEQWAEYMRMDNLEGIADPSDPQGIVDRLFVNGEINFWPRAFLWHTTQAMRTTLIPQLAQAAMQTAGAFITAPWNDQPIQTERYTAMAAQGEESVHASSLFAQSGVSTSNAAQPSLNVSYHPPASFVPSVVPEYQLLRPAGSSRVPSQSMPGPFQEQATHVRIGIGGSTLPTPRGRPARPNAYNNPYPPGAYSENVPRSGMPLTHSPHFIPAAAVMAQAGIPPHAAQPYAPSYPPISPSAHFAQPYLPNFGHLGMMPTEHIRPLNTSMQPVYVQQVPRGRGPRGTSIGDMTNTHHYNNGVTPQNMDAHRPDRRSGFYNSNGNNSLYDPQNGARPAFNDRNTGRKSSRGGFNDQGGRPRKYSGLDHRPRNASYGSDWAELTITHGARHYDHRMTRGHQELDPDITGDPIRGCHQTWIGPENYNVNELFVSDIPPGVEPAEVQDMFMREVSIFPVQAVVKCHPSGGRPHAFVLFSTPAEAKLALIASESNPKIRGMPVRISVPRRFYTKVDDFHNHAYPQQSSGRQAEGRDFSQVSPAPANEEQSMKAGTEAQTAKPQYSPQDARSDLQKKTDQLSPEEDFIPGGSEVVREKYEEQLPPTQTTAAPSEQLAVNDASEDISATQNEPASNAETIATEQEWFEQATAVSPSAVVGTDKDEASSAPPPATPQPSQAEVAQAVEDSPSHSSAPESAVTVGHSRVESQTKATFEVIAATAESSEVAATIVNIPQPAEVADNPAKQVSNTEEAVNLSAANHTSASNQKMASDEDAGPDSSFMSAHEVIDIDDPTAVTKAEISIANPGTEPSNKDEPKRSMVDESVLPASTTNSEVLRSSSLPDNREIAPTATTDQPKPIVEDVSVPAKDTEPTVAALTSPSGPVKDTEVMTAAYLPPSVAAKDTEPKNTTPAQSAAPVIKKPGPQQTPSLNPFAKPKKTQRKKDKEQKKKATKVKADEIAPDSGAKSSQSPTKQDSNVKITDADASAVSSQAQISKASNTTKVANKADVTTESGEAGASNVERKEKIVGKHAGGKATNISNAIGSVTHKTKVEQKATTAPVEESLSASAPLSRAQSPRRKAVPVPEQTAVLGTVVEGQSGKAGAAFTVRKVKKTVPAVPSLNLKAKPSSTHTQNTQTDSTTPSSIPATLASTQPPLNNMSPPAQEADAVSDTSSDTLHPSDAGRPSPSPAAEDFHTPLQTPTIPDAPQEQTATAEPKKKKRNKSKKKKKKAAASTPDASVTDNDIESTNNVDHEADPFGNQMSHIDAIREGLKNEDFYYNQVNKRMAERDAKIKSGELKEGEDETMGFGSDPTQFRKLQAFFMENPNLVRSMQDKASK